MFIFFPFNLEHSLICDLKETSFSDFALHKVFDNLFEGSFKFYAVYSQWGHAKILLFAPWRNVEGHHPKYQKMVTTVVTSLKYPSYHNFTIPFAAEMNSSPVADTTRLLCWELGIAVCVSAAGRMYQCCHTWLVGARGGGAKTVGACCRCQLHRHFCWHPSFPAVQKSFG